MQTNESDRQKGNDPKDASVEKRTTAAVDLIDRPPVDDVWAADRGYVIVIPARGHHANFHSIIATAETLGLDGEIRIDTDFMVDGEERRAIHLEAPDR